MADTFQSLSVGIWLVDEQEGTMALAASTSLPEAKGREVAPGKDESGAIIRHFQGHPEPADIELRNTSWAETLRRMHPSDFPNGGHRVCLPLIERGRVLGLLIIGDRVGGVPFSTQDFDMLRCVGDHAAVSLLTAQFSRSLLQAKEFEAFQTMAAFFVHDLKNAASTLNLMLQNLPVHFDDPAFREDALRGVGKTVDHINHLVSRLGLLRHELGIQPAEADLNDVVSKALETLGVGTDDQLIKEFSPSDRIQVDREQMSKVITNLVLNAVEASAGKGRVRVATRQDPGWAVITVEDSGCGMSEEFVRRSLFRPFQTTKKNGLGIGMFQSKMIVEAHRGRIAVESAPGRGTTFQVFLPVEAKT
jgi:putative PEP-CTERM system histidine kinase